MESPQAQKIAAFSPQLAFEAEAAFLRLRRRKIFDVCCEGRKKVGKGQEALFYYITQRTKKMLIAIISFKGKTS